MRRQRTTALVALSLGAAVLTGCGGGSSSAPATPAGPSAAAPGAFVFAGPSGAPLTALTFASAGTASAQSVVVSRSGDTGTFTQSNTCTTATSTIAGISPSSASGPQATFTVTPVAAGSCTVTITAADGTSASLTIGVTTTEFPVQ
ncbi:MAG TPA: hypothetical protein VMA36_05200 [Candidatus Limnocylindria bacterium]|nr:hypothetical protein [Candidatus Limnocylindria bacterium]